MRGGTRGARQYYQPGVRAHHQRYNIDAQARRQLAVALRTIEKHEPSVRLALEVADAPQALPLMKLALRLLTTGPNGDLR